METILIICIIVFTVLHIISSMLIFDFLKKKGEKVSFIFLRLLMFKYVNKYIEITRKESGKTGNLFYLWVVSINLTLAFLILYAIL